MTDSDLRKGSTFWTVTVKGKGYAPICEERLGSSGIACTACNAWHSREVHWPNRISMPPHHQMRVTGMAAVQWLTNHVRMACEPARRKHKQETGISACQCKPKKDLPGSSVAQVEWGTLGRSVNRALSLHAVTSVISLSPKTTMWLRDSSS